MTTLQIKDPNDGDVFEVPITKDARVFRQLGGEHYVELSFDSDKTLPLIRGCYVYIPSLSIFRYFLKNDATPEPITDVRGYKYVLKFYAFEHYMEACQLKWLTYGENNAITKRELTFSLTTSLSKYAKLIANNMNDHLGTTLWTFAEMTGDKYTKDMKELSFDGVSCWKAIGDIANAFGVEWWVEHAKMQAVIHFGKCEVDGETTPIREGEIVNRYPAAKRGENDNFATRYYIYGGTQNIPADYGGEYDSSTTNHISEKHLRPRDTNGNIIDYFDVVEVDNGQQVIEKTIILNDVFPKAETTIKEGDITTEGRTINGEDNVPIYLVATDKKPDLLGILGIHFTSGALMGRTFDAKIREEFFTEENNVTTIKTKIEIIPIIEGSAGAYQTVIPNKNLEPQKGDKYILTGVALDNDKIKAAEVVLYERGVALAKEYYADTNVYDCPVNPVYCKENNIVFDLGQKVQLLGAQFGEQGRYSRVQGYERKLYNPYIAIYNIGDNRIYSRYNVIETNLKVQQAESKKQQDKKDTNLKIQTLWGSSEQQVIALQNAVNELRGKDGDDADSTSIVGAKLYADNAAKREAALVVSKGLKSDANNQSVPADTADDNTVIGSKRYAEKLTKESNRLMIAGKQSDITTLGFRIIPSDEFKEKYNPTLSLSDNSVALLDNEASKYKGITVFVDKAYSLDKISQKAVTDDPVVLLEPLKMDLNPNDVLISDGVKWRKIANTTIAKQSGDISKTKLVQLLTIKEDNDEETFTPLATSTDLSNIEARVSKVEAEATATQRRPTVPQNAPIELVPNLLYDYGMASYDSITLPNLRDGDSSYDNKWMVRFVVGSSDRLTIPFDVFWKDGKAPSWSSWCICEITFTRDADGLYIMGEWKIYK